MNIAYQCSNSFLGPLLVSLCSLLENNSWIKRIRVFILSPDFSESNKNKVIALLSKYLEEYEVTIATIPSFQEFFGVKIDDYGGKWGQDSFMRLCFESFLPEDVHKILYLDSDVLICKDIRDLWNEQLEGLFAGAVSDFLSKEYYDYFELNTDADCYCNSGIILFNVDEMRRCHFLEKAKEYVVSKKGHIFFVEQTVFNIVCKRKIKHLPLKYNVTSNVINLSKKQLITLRNPVKNYAVEEFEEAKNNPSILHMTSSFFVVNRPWFEISNYKLKNVFDSYAKKVEGFVFYSDKRSNKKKAIDMIVKILPKTLLYSVIGKYYRKSRIKKYLNYVKHNG